MSRRDLRSWRLEVCDGRTELLISELRCIRPLMMALVLFVLRSRPDIIGVVSGRLVLNVRSHINLL